MMYLQSGVLAFTIPERTIVDPEEQPPEEERECFFSYGDTTTDAGYTDGFCLDMYFIGFSVACCGAISMCSVGLYMWITKGSNWGYMDNS